MVDGVKRVGLRIDGVRVSWMVLGDWLGVINFLVTCVGHVVSQLIILMDPTVVEKPVQVSENKRRPKYVQKGENGEVRPEGEQKKVHDKERDDKRDERRNERKEKRREKNEKEREERGGEDEFNIKREDITENTVVPKAPKKNEILKEPTVEEFKKREGEIIEKIKAAKEKRAKVLAEKYEPNKKGDKGKVDDFEKLREEVQDLRKVKEEAYKELELAKDRIKSVQTQIAEIDAEVDSFGGRNDNFFEKLKRVENELMTRKLTPKEEKDLTHERDNLRRVVNSVTSKLSGEEVEAKIISLKEKRKELHESLNELFDEKKPITEKYSAAKEKYTPVNEKFNAQKDERKNLKESQKTEFDKGRDEFNQKKTKKKENIDSEIDKLRDSIDDLWDEFGDKNREYKRQQRLINHINWLTKQKEGLAWKKEKERRDKEYEERKKENPIIKPKKYTPHVRNCEVLIEYCKKLNPKEEEKKVEMQEKQLSIEDIQSKLSEDSQWKKEKGVTLIQSKKTQDQDVEVVKKGKKNKKVEAQQEKPKKPAAYVHDLGVRNAFADVKVLCPDTVEDLQKTIKSLEQKLAEYTKLNDAEEVTVETVNPEGETEPVKEAPKEKRETKRQKLEVKEEDFPEL